MRFLLLLVLLAGCSRGGASEAGKMSYADAVQVLQAERAELDRLTAEYKRADAAIKSRKAEDDQMDREDLQLKIRLTGEGRTEEERTKHFDERQKRYDSEYKKLDAKLAAIKAQRLRVTEAEKTRDSLK